MMPAPIPVDESGRMRVPSRLEMIDTAAEHCFDAIVRLASLVCATPNATVTLIDHDRQWFKASVGLALPEGSRPDSFCGHAITGQDGLIVEDTMLDMRFRDNPLVVGAPHIRFYAGKPLRTPSGHAVGTLCVIDDRPRHLTSSQVDALSALADQASALLALRTRTQDYERELARRRRIESRLKIALNVARKARAVAERARIVADDANREKNNFLARMSHELRTPLNAIIGFSSVLLKNTKAHLDEREQTFASRIRANGHHLLHLVDDVLDIARIEVGHLSSARTEVSLEVVIAEMFDAMQLRVPPATGTSPRVQLHVEVPLLRTTLQTDEVRLKQILINLVTNALKFTREGHVTIRCVADESGTPVRVDVTDTGIGIPNDRLEAIFTQFEQAGPDTATRFGGAGLGLSISRSLAEMLGYTISVASELGKGTTFSLHLGHEAVHSHNPVLTEAIHSSRSVRTGDLEGRPHMEGRMVSPPRRLATQSV